VPNDGAFRGAVIGAGVSGVLSALSVLGVGFAGNILSKIPLSSIGFEWVLFAIVGFFVGWAIWGRDGKKTAPVETAPEEA
jgi:LIVCS family branched-chain amino acid:cation transporter